MLSSWWVKTEHELLGLSFSSSCSTLPVGANIIWASRCVPRRGLPGVWLPSPYLSALGQCGEVLQGFGVHPWLICKVPEFMAPFVTHRACGCLAFPEKDLKLADSCWFPMEFWGSCIKEMKFGVYPMSHISAFLPKCCRGLPLPCFVALLSIPGY